MWVVMRHQYGISALVPQTAFRGENSGGVSPREMSAVILFCFLWLLGNKERE